MDAELERINKWIWALSVVYVLLAVAASWLNLLFGVLMAGVALLALILMLLILGLGRLLLLRLDEVIDALSRR